MPDSLSDTIRGLVEAATELENDAPSEAELAAIIARGEFRPGEDEAIGFWFARYLSIRESLWAAIEEALERLGKPPDKIAHDRDMRYFLAGYAAACLLVRIDRLFLFRVADHSIIQRKLNEPFPEYRIPRKQYTKIFSAFVDEGSALAIYDAMKFARKNRPAIMRLSADPEVGFIVQQLDALESSLDPSKRNYLKGAWRLVSHKWRRRGVVSVQVTLAGLMEGLGRTASEFCETDNKNVDQNVLSSIAEFLQPGDVIVTRHAKALTNMFLPGFWPHASLYIGTPAQRKAAGIDPNDANERLQLDDICVLEARKDGVRLRPLDDTLAVDMFVVLRPNLERESIRQAIDRAVLHEGKMYNFDFDFFNSDRIVCTEVVYRAYDGLESLSFPLQERAGRKTLSAEDLLDFALDERAFEPVAIFGVKGCEGEIVHGEDVRGLLEESYRR